MSGRALGAPKDVEALARSLRREGWTVEQTRRSHLRWTRPDGEYTVTALTGNPHGVRRKVTELQRRAVGARVRV